MYSLEHSENFSRQSRAKTLPAAKNRASDAHLKAMSYFPWFFILRVSLFSSKTLRVPKFRQPSATETVEKTLPRRHCRALLGHLAGFSVHPSVCSIIVFVQDETVVIDFTWWDFKSDIVGFSTDSYDFRVRNSKNLLCIICLKQTECTRTFGSQINWISELSQSAGRVQISSSVSASKLFSFGPASRLYLGTYIK